MGPAPSSGAWLPLSDLKDAFHHDVAALRASVRPGFARRTFIPCRLTFGDSFRHPFTQGHAQGWAGDPTDRCGFDWQHPCPMTALRVDAHLQVAGFPNVYAVGDCADVAEPKTAYQARLRAAVAVSNIANSLSGKALTSDHTGHVAMLLAMGRDERCVVAMAKSGDLMLRKSWSEMKQTPPATQLQ
ncbi:LOW QUALITY PROTEIN: ferroptosis suppressor protein 1 [Neosynchiropus ocellatus]